MSDPRDVNKKGSRKFVLTSLEEDLKAIGLDIYTPVKENEIQYEEFQDNKNEWETLDTQGMLEATTTANVASIPIGGPFIKRGNKGEAIYFEPLRPPFFTEPGFKSTQQVNTKKNKKSSK